MYQLLAGVIIVVCFILGMNSRSISGGKEETKIPPGPGGDGVDKSATLGADTLKNRDQIKSELVRLAQAPQSSKGYDGQATCYMPVPIEPPIPDPNLRPESASTSSVDVTAEDKKPASLYSRAALRAELQKLASSTPPDRNSLRSNAKCYKVGPSATQTEYVCEKCKTKTVFSEKGAELIKKLESISEIRRLAAQISTKKIGVCLDESACCSKCSNGKPTGDIFVEISYAGENKPVRTSVNPFDLVLLLAFLEGSDRVRIYGPDCDPIKDHQKRLEEILGVSSENK